MGAAHRQIGGYTTTTGAARAAEDIWFRTDKAFTIANDALDVPADVEALPDMAGIGNVYSLQQAIVRDQTGQLKALLTQFTAATQLQRRAVFEQLFLKWTGADAYATDSRGSYLPDGRHAYAVEALLGEQFIQGGGQNAGTPNPGWNAAGKLEAIYGQLFEAYYGKIMSQTHLKSLYDTITTTWNAADQAFQGDLNAAAAQLATLINTNRTNGLAVLDEFVRTLRGMDMAAATNADQFRAGMATLGADVAAVIDNRWSGIAGTDIVDTLTGTNNADLLKGLGGNDNLNGMGGDDTLIGGAGDDILSGGAGNDLYLVDKGDGRDRILESDATPGNIDTIRFGAGILPGQVTVEIAVVKGAGAGGLDGDHAELCLKYNNGADQIGLGNWNEGFVSPIERVAFTDSAVVWDAAMLSSMIAFPTATEGADALYGTTNDDVINGLGGGDYIAGRSGSDTLNGGPGNDVLEGGQGNDVYLFGRGDGQDTMSDNDATLGNVDTIRFASNVLPADVKVTGDSQHLYLSIIGTTDRITVRNWFVSDADKIEKVAFTDGSGTVWDVAMLAAKVMTPTAGADTFDGGVGNDALFNIPLSRGGKNTTLHQSQYRQ